MKKEKNISLIKHIYNIIHYPGGKLSVLYGIFSSIYEEKEQYNFRNLCNTLNGSSVSPL